MGFKQSDYDNGLALYKRLREDAREADHPELTQLLNHDANTVQRLCQMVAGLRNLTKELAK